MPLAEIREAIRTSPNFTEKDRAEALAGLRAAQKSRKRGLNFQSNEANNIRQLFVWSATPQGHSYWSGVELKLVCN